MKPGLKVLDVGCGPGTVTVDVAGAILPGSIIGIDRAENLIEDARSLCLSLKLKNAEFKQADACDLPFDDNTFNLTYSNALLSWLPDPLKSLKEQKRVITETRRDGCYK